MWNKSQKPNLAVVAVSWKIEKLRGSISDVDIVPGRSPRSNRGNCDNSTSNQMITNTTEGYENDNDIINPVVGYEKHLDQKDKVGVE